MEEQEPGISEERVSFPTDAQSSVLSGSRKSRRSSRSSNRGSRSRENAAVESVLAEAKLMQLKRARERKLKQQLLLLENEIAEAEDEADLARKGHAFMNIWIQTREAKGLKKCLSSMNHILSQLIWRR